jgi:DNA-binding transcriptional ArsR family regulator
MFQCARLHSRKIDIRFGGYEIAAVENMSKSRTNRTLGRLVASPYCQGKNASRYADELKELATKVANKDLAVRESRLFKALGDDNRIRIMKLLMVRRMCVCEIMAALEMTQPTASHHLVLLEKEGLLRRRKEGKWAYYSLVNPKIVEAIKRLESLK